METREIGSSGIRASTVGLGTWAIGGWMWGGADEAASVAAIRASIACRRPSIAAFSTGFASTSFDSNAARSGRYGASTFASSCGK